MELLIHTFDRQSRDIRRLRVLVESSEDAKVEAWFELDAALKRMEEVERALAEREEECRELREAVGLMTTAIPSLEVDVRDPKGMAQLVAEECRAMWEDVQRHVGRGHDQFGELARALARQPAPEPKPDVYAEIRTERARQDEKWGGPEHDDTHGPNDWIRLIRERNAYDLMGGWEAEFRRRMVVIAALAVAGIETHDRVAKKPAPEGGES